LSPLVNHRVTLLVELLGGGQEKYPKFSGPPGLGHQNVFNRAFFLSFIG